MSQYETLEVTQDGSVMIIALNRPEKMNTFNTCLLYTSDAADE